MTTPSSSEDNTRPEKLSKRRQFTLPKHHQILTPELPFALQKRSSVRSQLTSITQDTQSTVASDALSDVLARKLNKGDDGVGTGRSQASPSSFFIPGITGKARCLETSKEVAARRTEKCIDGKGSATSSSRSSTKRLEKSIHSRVSASDSRHSSQSCSSETRNNNSERSLDCAGILYGAVVESIQARRDEGLTDLNEEEFQRMLSLLHPDEAEPSLRQEVNSLRMILSDFERKELLKQRKSKKR